MLSTVVLFPLQPLHPLSVTQMAAASECKQVVLSAEYLEMLMDEHKDMQMVVSKAAQMVLILVASLVYL